MLTSSTLKISQVVHSSSIYGPGLRTVIWVQGCSLACVGCWNQDLWSKKGGYEVTVTELVASAIQSNDQGLTILGGEPLEQPPAIYSLIEEAKEKGLSIFLYSGFEDKELTNLQRKCVDASDIVVLGRYVQAKRDTTLRWRGSSNQKVMFPSERYAHLEIQEANEVEIHLQEDGTLRIIGYPDEEIVNNLLGHDL